VRPNPLENTFWVGMSDELGRPFALEENSQPEERFYTYGIIPVLGTYLPQFQLRYPDAAWAEHYDMSFDGLPIVYEPYESDLVIAAGTSGSSVMKGDSIGRVAAALLTSLASEANVSAVMVEEASAKARGLTFDARIASDMASLALAWGKAAKDVSLAPAELQAEALHN